MDTLQLPKDEIFVAGKRKTSNYYHNLIKNYSPLIFLCTKGSGHLTIDLNECEVKANSLLFFLPGSIISCSKLEEEMEFMYIICARELFQEAAFRFEHSYLEYLKTNPTLQFTPNDIKGIKGCIQAVIDLYEDKKHVFRIPILKNYLQCFLMEVYDKSFRRSESMPTNTSNRKEALFKNFLNLVHEHYLTEREVSFYANKLCITSRYLSTVINSVCGHTPKEVIDSFVILEIKALLQSTDMSMQEIANELHFPDQSFFGRYFKKHTGMMPSRYRLENKHK